ncbi:M6 family metalloprotease domain-containing protein [Nocardioides guangzhouensis]|uniref:M6 family metalloprotease domain-containing protein n=2 Tax=Nocardioides guangzhouensis TaxID=2497878 RepID=A0A4Q4ZLG6_9ACTN|nr:M6 family metalloprotease domain-containing protein [Nocardioides guangzhouensis]
MLAPLLRYSEPRHPGFNDGLLYPGTYYPVGTTLEVARAAALERAPLRGTVRVIVVLVDFSDHPMPNGADARFRDLFFSTGVLPHGSVKEYYTEASKGLITLDGEVVGPYRLPQPVATYAGAENGTQAAAPNARTMANDAVTAADPHVGFAPYDNDGNGYVDAFVVVHAGRGAEQTGAAADIWSHKWVLPAERTVDGTKIFPYLTIPDDARIGVCAHELGHLLFGWPDLYDTDNTSEGIGNWCLMGAGSWGLGGDRPVHPSAWCKANQGWANVIAQTSNGHVNVTDVKSSGNVHRLWKDGAPGNEYFLVENRLQTGYDASMPGQGLLIWHIDDAVATNRDESHYKVALVQADGKKDLENNRNRGDAGDPYPGSSGNTSFTDSSTPNSKSYAGANTCVSVTEIPALAPTVRVWMGVRCFVKPPIKEGKEVLKEIRDKWLRDQKGFRKEVSPKELSPKELSPKEVSPKELREGGKFRDLPDPRRWFGGDVGQAATDAAAGDLDERVAALEATVDALASMITDQGAGGQADTGSLPPGAEPFIGSSDRPTLSTGDDATNDEGPTDAAELRAAMESGSAAAKRAYDTPPAG